MYVSLPLQYGSRNVCFIKLLASATVEAYIYRIYLGKQAYMYMQDLPNWFGWPMRTVYSGYFSRGANFRGIRGCMATVRENLTRE